MERATRLRRFWAWLPVFRAVAETEHLPTASEALHVSASSLSRTIRLLEADIGTRLFDRVGRQIVLNASGKAFLRGVRESMRRVDEALAEVGPGRMIGDLTISVPAPFALDYVLPGLVRLLETQPGLHPVVKSTGGGREQDMLARGDLDIAVMDDATPDEDLTVVELAQIPHALCCGEDHPLCGLQPPLEEIVKHGFVAPTAFPDGRVPDRWPAHIPRTIALSVVQLQVGLDACATGAYLAVLPWPLARRRGLQRIPMGGIGRSVLCALHRPSLGPDTRAETVANALRAAIPPNEACESIGHD